MAVRLEHANLTVRDINGMVVFLQTAFPEFRVRGEGKSRDGSRWVHVGTDETWYFYIMYGVIEVILTLLIVWYAWTWLKEASNR